MNNATENVALFHLIYQDTKNLYLDELYALYIDTYKEVCECEKRYQDSHKEERFSFN